MANGEIRIRIGAIQDRSVDAVFGNVEKRALRARDNINRTFGGAGSGALGSSLANIGKQAEASARQTDKAWSAQMRALNNYARLQDREWKRSAQEKIKAEAAANRAILKDAAATNRARLKDERETSQAIVREFKKQVREREQSIKSQQREEVRTRRNFAERTSHRAVRFLFPPPSGIIGSARRTASDMLRGAGVDFSVGSSVSRNVALSMQLARLQNQAGLNGQSVSHGELEGAVKGSADKYGFDRGDAASALGAFADRTGDMKLGTDVLPQLAERAAASGSSLQDMLSAAGEVAMNLGPVKDKAKALVGVLDAMTIQGAKGAIEMKDLARSGMARIASGAGRYEGDAAQNMVKLGALAQLARQSGGASSPAEAATAVARMTDQFTTGARIKQFKAHGVDVFSSTEKGQIRDPISIIKDALLKTGGNPEALKKMFMSSIGAKPVMALAKEFNSAGGGAKGVAAVDKLLAGFMQSANIQSKLDAANARRDQEVATKAQKFQNKLDDVTAKMAGELLPALEGMAEPALKVANAFAGLVTWATRNPGQAIVAAITASIARAGLESAFRAAIERAITSGGINIGQASATIGSATLAIAGLSAAWGASDELGQAVGVKSRATDVLTPGRAKGEWSWGQAAQDAAGFMSGGPLGYLADKGGAIAGEYAQGAYRTLTEPMAKPMSKETWEARMLGKLAPGGAGGAGGAGGTASAASNQSIDPSQLSTGVTAGLLDAGVLKVHVVNQPAPAAPPLPGPRVAPHGRSPR